MPQRLTKVVLNLLIINVLVYIALAVFIELGPKTRDINRDYFTLHKSNLLGFRDTGTYTDGDLYFIETMNGVSTAVAYADKFEPIQILTSFFNHSHSGLMHIIFNMLALVMIGPIIEMTIGSKRFLKFYMFCGLFGGLLVAFIDPSSIPVLGASGAISGLLVAFGMYYPDAKLLLFFVIPMKARQAAFLWGGFSLVGVILGALHIDFVAGISHFGHLAGMIAALTFFYGAKYLPDSWTS